MMQPIMTSWVVMSADLIGCTIVLGQYTTRTTCSIVVLWGSTAALVMSEIVTLVPLRRWISVPL